MFIPRYWAKGEATAVTPEGDVPVFCWRWSAESLAEARQNAEEAAAKAARNFSDRNALYNYGYTDRPPREEIVREITDESPEVTAIITRNIYGSLVLNTRDLMFIDVDVPWESSLARLGRWFAGLFGRNVGEPAEVALERIREVAHAQPGLTFRVYRTYAGFRIVVVNRSVDPDSEQSSSLLERFDADPLYVKLCQAQKCYRARMTPKFWRCGAKRPPNRYPWKTEEEEQTYRQWQSDYESRIRDYTTCRLVETIGAASIGAHLRMLIELHDMLCDVYKDFQLA